MPRSLMTTAQLLHLHPPLPLVQVLLGRSAPSSPAASRTEPRPQRDSGSHPAMSLTSCAVWARVSWPPSLCETRVLQHQERRESEIADWDPREPVLPPSLLGISRSPSVWGHLRNALESQRRTRWCFEHFNKSYLRCCCRKKNSCLMSKCMSVAS